MSTSTYYIVHGIWPRLNIRVYTEPPTMCLHLEGTITWDGRSGSEVQQGSYYAPKMFPLLAVPPATCWRIEVETNENDCVIRVVDRNVECKKEIWSTEPSKIRSRDYEA